MAKFKQMNKSELLKLVTEVSTSLKTIGAAELTRLAKADPSAPPEGSSPGGSMGSPEGSSSSSSSSGSPEGSSGSPGDIGGDPTGAPPGADPSAPPAGPPGADPSAGGPPPGADPSAAPPGAEGQAPAGPSFEELVSLYSALPPPDLEAHAAALQQAVAMKQGGAGAPPGAPPAGPPGASPSAGPGAPPAGPPGASPSAPPFGKQEVATHNPNIGLAPGGGSPGQVETSNPNIGPTKKSEEDLLARLSKAENDLAKFGEVVEKILTIPQRKAVTGLTIIPMAKKEAPIAPVKKAFADLTKSELHNVLKSVTDPRSGKLSKAERDVVTEYVLNPASVDLSAIESIYNKS